MKKILIPQRKRLRRITRKAGCLDCRNSSSHKKTCPWAYVPEPNSKAWNREPWLTLRKKNKKKTIISQIMEFIIKRLLKK